MGLREDQGLSLVLQSAQDVADKIRLAGHQGFHLFSVGTLAGYYRLFDPKIMTRWEEPGLLTISGLGGRNRSRAFCYSPDVAKERLHELRQLMPITSVCDLGLQWPSKIDEVVYDLERVLDPSAYPNSNKRYNRLKRPDKWLAARDIEIRPITPDDLVPLERLHEEWVAHKLEEKTTVRIMFPREKYLRCCKFGLLEDPAYPTYGAFYQRRLVSVRSFYREDDWAWELAFIGVKEVDGLAHLSECLAFVTMRSLQQNWVRHLNAGSPVRESLRVFKQHWPSRTVTYYSYARIKS